MAVGTWLAKTPHIGREILAAGHDVGNHTLSRADINSLTEARIRTEVFRCRDILQRTTGQVSHVSLTHRGLIGVRQSVAGTDRCGDKATLLPALLHSRRDQSAAGG